MAKGDKPKDTKDSLAQEEGETTSQWRKRKYEASLAKKKK